MNTIDKDSPIWKEAQELLARQGKLHAVLRESMSTMQFDFREAVAKIRRVVSRSPRTILHQALNLLGVDERLPELLLSAKNSRSVYDIGKALDTLSKAKTGERLQAAREKLEQHDNENGGDDAMIQRITCGIKQKRGSTVSPLEVQRIIEGKQGRRRKRLEGQVERLEKEHFRFKEAMHLWKECGGEVLWENYKYVNLRISENRRQRGSNFEDRCSELAFAMIALQVSPSQPWNLSYERSMHWIPEEKS